jgi:hypothetical protein
MTHVLGEIETLKRIKSELKSNGITRFNSVGSMTEFLKSYSSEREELIGKTREQVEADIAELLHKSEQLRVRLAQITQAETERIAVEIEQLDRKVAGLERAIAKEAFLIQVSALFQQWAAQLQLLSLKWGRKRRIANKIGPTKRELKQCTTLRDKWIQNKEEEIQERCGHQLNELDHTKEVIDQLALLISGAIGENKVVKALKTLSDENTLINDYSLSFKKPIRRKSEGDRIFSIQIDHLLITRAGLFIIETKNWSKDSVDNYDLRSPVEQIQRSSYALFVLLNGKPRRGNFWLKRHHWGKRKVPIRNVIAVTGYKPNETFNHVAIKADTELVNYISYFNPVFSKEEVNEISAYLERLYSDNL